MTTPPKPPADALLDVKETPRTDALAQRLDDEINCFAGEMTMPQAAAFMSKFGREFGAHARQLETSLRSSEAALAEAKTEVAKAALRLTAQEKIAAIWEDAARKLEPERDAAYAELTALRANAGTDKGELSEMSDTDLVTLTIEKAGCLAMWNTKEMFVRVGECRSELLQRLIFRATTPPASLASGGEK